MTEHPRNRPPYRYQCVSGVSVWQREPGSLRQARRTLAEVRRQQSDAEIERVCELHTAEGFGGGRRYWRWRGRRWSTAFWTTPTSMDLAKWAAKKESA
jgi:hypothetical protein